MLVTGYVLGKNLLERDEAVETLEAGLIDAGCSGHFLEMIFLLYSWVMKKIEAAAVSISL